MNHSATDVAHLERDEIARRLAGIRERIEAVGGDLSRIKVVAVTKTFPVSVCEAAIHAGIRDFGENYAAELIDKAQSLSAFEGGALRWHFIGDVQRNKVRRLAPHVALWESVDRREEGAAIARAVPGAAVLVEVRCAETTTPGGVATKEVPALVDELRNLGLVVRGLMTIGPLNDPRLARASFRSTRELADRLELLEVSMGMTDDLEIAVEEGSTMVRVGRALFGPRPAAL